MNVHLFLPFLTVALPTVPLSGFLADKESAKHYSVLHYTPLPFFPLYP